MYQITVKIDIFVKFLYRGARMGLHRGSSGACNGARILGFEAGLRSGLEWGSNGAQIRAQVGGLKWDGGHVDPTLGSIADLKDGQLSST